MNYHKMFIDEIQNIIRRTEYCDFGFGFGFG